MLLELSRCVGVVTLCWSCHVVLELSHCVGVYDFHTITGRSHTDLYCLSLKSWHQSWGDILARYFPGSCWLVRISINFRFCEGAASHSIRYPSLSLQVYRLTKFVLLPLSNGNVLYICLKTHSQRRNQLCVKAFLVNSLPPT